MALLRRTRSQWLDLVRHNLRRHSGGHYGGRRCISDLDFEEFLDQLSLGAFPIVGDFPLIGLANESVMLRAHFFAQRLELGHLECGQFPMSVCHCD